MSLYAPSAAEAFPAAHAMQDAPSLELYLPPGHLVHWLWPTLLTKPGGHPTQEMDPWALLYLPAAHKVQLPDLGEELNLPTGHIEHWADDGLE